MNLRFAWGASALLVWMGCGGAFTTIDPGADAGGSTTGGAGTASTGAGGDTGVAGSSSGSSGSSVGTGGSSNGSGGSTSGAGGGTAGMSGGTGGSGGNRGPDWGACDGPGQCVAIEASCCSSCGTPDVSGFVGVNTKRVQDFHSQQCPNPVVCPNIACPFALTSNANIAARCVAGTCQAFDVRKVPEYSGCTVDTDCHLRLGLGCCTCNATGGWVAVGKSGEQGIGAAECAPNTACLDCAAIPPADLAAVCTNHVCTAVSLKAF